MFNLESFNPASFISRGEIKINGKAIKYRSVCEDNLFYDNNGKPIASIFSFSYFRDDVENQSNRPVVFAFNGGPGSSSCMLHIGFLGPRRMKYSQNLDLAQSLPPYEVIDNPECILDIADIVMIDPVATGYGVLLDDSYSSSFFGIKEDAESVVNFIQRWLEKYNRFNSPKYIVGESYGCARAAMVAEIATGPGTDRCYDFTFDGLFLIGNTITTGQYFNIDVPVEKSVLSFPTYAAINWYHNTDHSISVDKWVEDAKHFADTEYLLGLYKGVSLKGKEREDLKKKITYFTGVSDEYLESRYLKIDSYSVKNEVIKKKGKAVSRLDGRITRDLYTSFFDEEKYGMANDAVRGRYNPIFLACLETGLFPSLGIKDFSRPYKSAIKISSSWNKKTDFGISDCLNNAMRRSPKTRVFFASGYYDLTTEIGLTYYMLDHANLPLERVTIKGYHAGHMVYLGEDNIKIVSKDLRDFIGENNG